MSAEIESIGSRFDAKGLLVAAIKEIDRSPHKTVGAHVCLINEKGELFVDSCGVETQALVFGLVKELIRAVGEND